MRSVKIYIAVPYVQIGQILSSSGSSESSPFLWGWGGGREKVVSQMFCASSDSVELKILFMIVTCMDII